MSLNVSIRAENLNKAIYYGRAPKSSGALYRRKYLNLLKSKKKN